VSAADQKYVAAPAAASSDRRRMRVCRVYMVGEPPGAVSMG
jgi:hypothetical protein